MCDLIIFFATSTLYFFIRPISEMNAYNANVYFIFTTYRYIFFYPIYPPDVPRGFERFTRTSTSSKCSIYRVKKRIIARGDLLDTRDEGGGGEAKSRSSRTVFAASSNGWILLRKKTFIPDGGEFPSLDVAVSSLETALGRLEDNSVLIPKGLKSLSSLRSFSLPPLART